MVDSVSSSSSEVKAASTANGARAWQKLIENPSDQTRFTATDIGWIKRNNSRLNVISNIGKNDTAQYLKFNVVTDGKLSMAYQTEKALRIEVMDQNGRTIADSDKSSGALYEKFQALMSSDLTVKTGVYTVKVTRDSSVPPKAEFSFAMQFKMGDTYTDDYVTRIAPEQKKNVTVGATTNPVTGLMPAVLAAQSNSYTFDPAANAAIFDILAGAG